MSDLARALLDQIATDPVALDRLRELVNVPIETEDATDAPKLLTVTEAAERLGRSPKTVRRRIADGSLLALLDHGRPVIRADDLDAYVEGLDRVSSGDGLARPTRRRARRGRDYGFLRDPS